MNINLYLHLSHGKSAPEHQETLDDKIVRSTHNILTALAHTATPSFLSIIIL